MEKILVLTVAAVISILTQQLAFAETLDSQTKVSSLNSKGVKAYKAGDYKKAKIVLNKALALTKDDSLERLEVLNNLWVTYLRLDDLESAKSTKDKYDALDKKLDTPPDMVFTKGKKKKSKAKYKAPSSNRIPIQVKRVITVSGLTLRKKDDKYYVDGLLINRTKKSYRSVTIDMELTMDDASEEFETIFLKGIGPETSKNFEKEVTIESKTARPVMATVIKVNSLDFDSFDFYKPMRKQAR